MWFFSLIFGLCVLAVAVAFGAKYHNQVNARIARFIGQGDGLPPDFELWLANHKGEYDTIGKAMCAWADARFGDKYNKMLR